MELLETLYLQNVSYCAIFADVRHPWQNVKGKNGIIGVSAAARGKRKGNYSSLNFKKELIFY